MKTVLTTICKREDAEKMAEALLREKLAACVNMFPVESTYWWKGGIEKESEFVMMIKTKNSLAGKLEKRIVELHPYELPVIEVIDSKTGKSVEKWIDEVTR